MRTYSSFAKNNSEVTQLLGALVDLHATPEAYRRVMHSLGAHLAKAVLASSDAGPDTTFCVVCTADDADFLARGVLEGMVDLGVAADRLKFVCFWNKREKIRAGSSDESVDIAPVVKSYREQTDLGRSIVVMVKSIIASGCVVKTNLTTLINNVVPHRVVIASPVMLEGADDRLAAEFPTDVANLFKYVTFAVDNERVQDMVVPGIGGSVYERLGLGDLMQFVPEIVRLRRSGSALAHA